MPDDNNKAEIDVILRKIGVHIKRLNSAVLEEKQARVADKEEMEQKLRDSNARLEIQIQGLLKRIEELETRPFSGEQEKPKEEPKVDPVPEDDPGPSEQNDIAVARIFKRSWER